MNPLNELKLAIEHLANCVGSMFFTGHSLNVLTCALGSLEFVWSLFPHSQEKIEAFELEGLNELFENVPDKN